MPLFLIYDIAAVPGDESRGSPGVSGSQEMMKIVIGFVYESLLNLARLIPNPISPPKAGHHLGTQIAASREILQTVLHRNLSHEQGTAYRSSRGKTKEVGSDGH